MASLPFNTPAIPSCDNNELRQRIQAHLDDLTKPAGSLGRLEECAMRYLLCRGSADARIRSMQLFTFAGDHGVTRQKITPFPSEVTGQMVYNMLGGGAAVSVMCRKAGIGYAVVDMGVATDFPDHEMLVSRKVACGTADFSQGPAMTDDECAQAIRAGIALAATSPADLFGCGEMGIGNSASASALYALLLSIDGKETTGAGTGATGELLAHKKKVVAEAVSLHRSQWDRSPFDALRRCGGYEIAGITGLLIGAASRRIPVVIDGFICSAAALVAIRMCPQVGGYLFFSHVSEEQFHRTFLAGEKAFPLLDLGMRLGEGTGAVLAMQIIGQALACYHEMATFSSASVSNKAGV